MTTRAPGLQASFAALCGVSSIENASGRIQRCRLDRNAAWQPNTALFRIVLTSCEPSTRLYVERRTTDGMPVCTHSINVH